MSREAAKVVAAEIEKNPDCVLALPERNPSAFTELVGMHKERQFSRVTTFNLDEYLGLPGSQIQLCLLHV